MTQTPVPVQPLDYSMADDSIFRSLRRCLGWMSLIYGVIQIAAVILAVFAFIHSPYRLNQYSRNATTQSFISWILALFHGALVIGGGGHCLKGWRGRGLLLAAAWLGLILATHATVASSIFAIQASTTYYRSNPLQAAATVATYTLHGMSGVLFSLLTLIFLQHPTIRRRFQADP